MIKNLPQGWRVEKLDDIVFFQEGPGVRNTQFRNQGVKLLNVGNINDNKINLDATKIYISEEEAYGKYSHFLVDDGDLLIACSGIVVENFHKKISFISKKDLPLCLNTSTMRFKTLNEKILNINFYKYFLMSDIFKHQLQKLITGSAQLNFGPSHIKKMFAPLPPLPQQEKIVKVLDKSASLIEQQKQLIEKYDVFLKSKFIEMFGDPITNPMGWEVKKLGDLAKVQTGKTPSRKNSDYWTNGTVNWAKTTEVNQNYIIEVEEKITDLAVKECHMIVFQENTILIAMYGQGKTRGKVVLLGVSATINQAFGAILPSSKYETLYLLKLLDYMYENIRDLGRGGNQENLNLDIVRGINIILPPKELQNKFAFLATKIQAIKEKEAQKLNYLETLHVSLMDKAFKGEIV